MTSSPFTPAQNDGADRPRRRATRPAAAPTATADSPAFRSTLATEGEGGNRRRRGGRGRGAGPRPEGRPVVARAAETVPVAPIVPVGADATVLPTDATFAELGVPAPLVEVLTTSGITSPFPIQVATLPDTLAGRDVLGRGRTGSGKTLAFSIPLVARLAASTSKRQPKRPRALILVPTRELANQVNAVVDPLARALGMRSTVVFGGVGQNPQVQALAAGVDVLIACPGRLEDLIGQGHADLGAVEITILDEADHMADLGFLPGVKRLLDRTPKVGQRLLFSATLDNGVDVLVKRYLDRPTTHSVDPAVAPVSTMTHHVFRVDPLDKSQIVKELASGLGRSVLFTRTKHQAPPACPPSTCTATSARTPASATSRRSAAARPGCSARPTSPPAASTSTTWRSWCTSTRRPSTRPTCTARAGPPAPAPAAPWSPSRRRTRPPRCARWPARPGSARRSRRSSRAPGRSPR
jgi:hypothetical protein